MPLSAAERNDLYADSVREQSRRALGNERVPRQPSNGCHPRKETRPGVGIRKGGARDERNTIAASRLGVR